MFVGLGQSVVGGRANMGRLHLRSRESESFTVLFGRFLDPDLQRSAMIFDMYFSILLLLLGSVAAQERDKFCIAAKPPLALPGCTVSTAQEPHGRFNGLFY